MTQITVHIERTTRRFTILAVPLLIAMTGTAAAQGGGSYGGGEMMGGSGWGLFGGAMGIWGLLWMGLPIAILLYIGYTLLKQESTKTDEQPLSVLRERYARGELSADEFERRRTQIGGSE